MRRSRSRARPPSPARRMRPASMPHICLSPPPSAPLAAATASSHRLAEPSACATWQGKEEKEGREGARNAESGESEGRSEWVPIENIPARSPM
eukprot:1176466-Prorocentrum_minimum.AAC.1